MGAYILRRLLLIIPTLLGIMIINFALVQFVPGGPIEQIIAQIEGQGDVFGGFSGGGGTAPGAGMDTVGAGMGGGGNEKYVGARGLPPEAPGRVPGTGAEGPPSRGLGAGLVCACCWR